jgi:hypothetical protein
MARKQGELGKGPEGVAAARGVEKRSHYLLGNSECRRFISPYESMVPGTIFRFHILFSEFLGLSRYAGENHAEEVHCGVTMATQ